MNIENRKLGRGLGSLLPKGNINQEEKNFIKLMAKATNLIIKARTTKGAETTDHYSMMGFTKAYNTAKKTCN